MPIRVLNNKHWNTGPPIVYSDYALGSGAALDTDAIVTTNSPSITNAAATGAANDATVTGDTLPAGMVSLVLNEQFTTMNTTRWGLNGDGANYGSTANQIGKWTNAPTVSAATSGGTGNSLKLTSTKTAAQTYQCAMVGSRDGSTPTYYPVFGRYEFRYKLPGHMQGLWPAIWLRHRNGSSMCEVDIMEYFHAETPGKMRVTLHRTNNAGTFQANVSKVSSLVEAPTLTPSWHTCAVTMLPSGANVQFTCEYDGVQVWSYLDTQAVLWSNTNGTAAYNSGLNVFDIAIQGSQISGNYVCNPEDPKGYSRYLDKCVSGGTSPNACTTTVGGQPIWTDAANYGGAGFPNTFEIDYVKVWSAI